MNIEKAGKNSEIKVLIIQSDGDGAFCAGASFDELIEISNQEEGKKFFMGFARLINAIRRCPKFIIARVQGKAVSGGVGIAAAADYTLAHKSADIKLSELSIGIGPFVIEPAVRRKIGQAAFSTLTIDATSWHSAAWARQKGLYAHIFDTQEIYSRLFLN
ncbi:MAG: enoyl-CoA hydratase/isomerase family protein [Balneolaceae bacterium]|nr:enoyl-CoA hydratase/isomerase family protein [Balneolaceae bacterium]